MSKFSVSLPSGPVDGVYSAKVTVSKDSDGNVKYDVEVFFTREDRLRRERDDQAKIDHDKWYSDYKDQCAENERIRNENFVMPGS
jgi:hypothetical protein